MPDEFENLLSDADPESADSGGNSDLEDFAEATAPDMEEESAASKIDDYAAEGSGASDSENPFDTSDDVKFDSGGAPGSKVDNYASTGGQMPSAPSLVDKYAHPHELPTDARAVAAPATPMGEAFTPNTTAGMTPEQAAKVRTASGIDRSKGDEYRRKAQEIMDGKIDLPFGVFTSGAARDRARAMQVAQARTYLDMATAADRAAVQDWQVAQAQTAPGGMKPSGRTTDEATGDQVLYYPDGSVRPLMKRAIVEGEHDGNVGPQPGVIRNLPVKGHVQGGATHNPPAPHNVTDNTQYTREWDGTKWVSVPNPKYQAPNSKKDKPESNIDKDAAEIEKRVDAAEKEARAQWESESKGLSPRKRKPFSFDRDKKRSEIEKTLLKGAKSGGGTAIKVERGPDGLLTIPKKK